MPPLLSTPLAPLLRYDQVNFRTYVHGPAGPGLWLLETRVSHPLALGARLLGMPYHLDTSLSLEVRQGDRQGRPYYTLLRRSPVGTPVWRVARAELRVRSG
jgi:hypothetical protein